MCCFAVGTPKLRVHSLGNPFVPFGDQFSLCRFNADDILLNSVHKLNNPTIYSPTKRQPRSCHMISSGTNPLNQFYRRNPMRTQVLLLRPFIYNCHATSTETPSAVEGHRSPCRPRCPSQYHGARHRSTSGYLHQSVSNT